MVAAKRKRRSSNRPGATAPVEPTPPAPPPAPPQPGLRFYRIPLAVAVALTLLTYLAAFLLLRTGGVP